MSGHAACVSLKFACAFCAGCQIKFFYGSNKAHRGVAPSTQALHMFAASSFCFSSSSHIELGGVFFVFCFFVFSLIALHFLHDHGNLLH